jgi:hypothetical protein
MDCGTYIVDCDRAHFKCFNYKTKFKFAPVFEHKKMVIFRESKSPPIKLVSRYLKKVVSLTLQCLYKSSSAAPCSKAVSSSF